MMELQEILDRHFIRTNSAYSRAVSALWLKKNGEREYNAAGAAHQVARFYCFDMKRRAIWENVGGAA